MTKPEKFGHLFENSKYGMIEVAIKDDGTGI
jgi:hypothetical protein